MANIERGGDMSDNATPPIAPADLEIEQRFHNLFAAIYDGTDPQLLAEFVGGGGCIRDALLEHEQYFGPNKYDIALDRTRSDYMAIMLTKPHFWNRESRKAHLAIAADAYVDSFVAKMMAYVDADDTAAMLELHQIPSMMGKTHFHDGVEVAKEDFVANHGYLLMDTALQEHNARRAIISSEQEGTLTRRIATNRYVRIGAATLVFGLASVPELQLLPIDKTLLPDEAMANYLETIVKYASAAVFGVEAPEIIRLKRLQYKHDKRTRELEFELAKNPTLTDLALRLVYGSVRYGDNPLTSQRQDRHGSDDAEINLDRLHSLDSTFDRLHNDQGGKPYTGPQAIGYAARLLVERSEQIDSILDLNTSSQDKRAQFAQLAREILLEDLDRMKQGLTITRARKEIMKILGAIPAIFFNQELSIVSDAMTLARDTTNTALGESKQHIQTAEL